MKPNTTRHAEPRRDTQRITLDLLAEICETDVERIAGAQRLREDLGMDSLQSLELLSCVGETLKIDLDIEEAMGIQTVDDACAFVRRQYEEQRGHGGS
jgi:acyl carrier protein